MIKAINTLRRIIKRMPNFKRMHQFVTYVHSYNTKDYEEDDATLNNLTDENYLFIKAIKKDNALRKFKDKFKYNTPEVSKIYNDAIELEFIKKMTTENNPRVAGEIILMEFKGEEFIHKSKRLKLSTGKWEAVLNYHDKKLILAVALIGGGILGNIETILRWVF